MSIEAMKQVLDELQYVLDSSTNEDLPLHGNSFNRTLSLLNQAIEQAEKQELVGEIEIQDMGRPFNAGQVTVRFYQDAPAVGTKLYSAPPKREWVGLTDEELYDLWCITKPEYEDRYDFARAVEAKLKEKNT